MAAPKKIFVSTGLLKALFSRDWDDGRWGVDAFRVPSSEEGGSMAPFAEARMSWVSENPVSERGRSLVWSAMRMGSLLGAGLYRRRLFFESVGAESFGS